MAEMIRSASQEEETAEAPQAPTPAPAKMKKHKCEKENILEEEINQRPRSPETSLREIPSNIKLLKYNYEEKPSQNINNKLERIPKQTLINNNSLSYLQRIQ